jgi:hypothetical protein
MLIALDVFGTLADPASASAALAQLCGPEAVRVATVWRSKQLEYMFRVTAMGSFPGFSDLTRWALLGALGDLGSMLRLTLPWRAWPTAIGACNRLETCFPRWRTCTGPATSWWRSLWRHGCGWKISRANTGHSYLDLLALRMRACTSRTRVYTSICCAPPAPTPRRRSWSRRILSTSSAVGPSAWVPPGADETPGWFLIHGDLGPTTRSRRCWTCPGWSSRFDAPPAWSSGRPPTGHGSRYVRRQQSGRRWHGSRTRHKHRYRHRYQLARVPLRTDPTKDPSQYAPPSDCDLRSMGRQVVAAAGPV